MHRWRRRGLTKRLGKLVLECYELATVLGYAGNEGWIVDPREGWISLTNKGEAAARGTFKFSETLRTRLGLFGCHASL